MHQQTIQKEVHIRGKGLHSGLEITMHIHPAPANTGIVFVRCDLPHKPKIQAHAQNLTHRMRCTALVCNQGEVHTTEHFLATCLAMNLTNLMVEIDGPEIPGMDGSALPFYQTLKESGIESQSEPAKKLILSREISQNEGKANIRALPYHGGLKLEYYLEYDVSYLTSQHICWDITEETFAKEIAPSRTFALKEEVNALLKLGLGKGANTQNTLIIDEKGQIIENSLRFPDECARHKMLDLLGDIALLGCYPQAHIIARRSGHTLNALLLKELLSLIDSK